MWDPPSQESLCGTLAQEKAGPRTSLPAPFTAQSWERPCLQGRSVQSVHTDPARQRTGPGAHKPRGQTTDMELSHVRPHTRRLHMGAETESTTEQNRRESETGWRDSGTSGLTATGPPGLRLPTPWSALASGDREQAPWTGWLFERRQPVVHLGSRAWRRLRSAPWFVLSRFAVQRRWVEACNVSEDPKGRLPCSSGTHSPQRSGSAGALPWSGDRGPLSRVSTRQHVVHHLSPRRGLIGLDEDCSLPTS